MQSNHDSPQQQTNAAQVRNTRSRNGGRQSGEWRHPHEARFKVELLSAPLERKAPNFAAKLASPSQGS